MKWISILVCLLLAGCGLLRPAQDTNTTVGGSVDTLTTVMQQGAQPEVLIAVAVLGIGLVAFLICLAYKSHEPDDPIFRIIVYCVMVLSVLGPVLAVAFALSKIGG